MKQLQDKVAVITGAGSGIGRALALELARRGCHLAITDLEEAALAPVAEAVGEQGRRVSVHAFDVSERGAWPEFVADVLAAHGAAHLLVNNAGVSLTGPFLSCSLDDLEWQLRVNLNGVMYGCHGFLPHLLEQGEGHVVNLSSIFGIISVPDNAAYCMSKHAVRSLTEALEIELWDTPVVVTSVHPGAVATRIVSGGRFREGGFTSSERARKMISEGLAPEEAARIIADGIQRDERRILVGRDARLLARIQQAMPLMYRNLTHWWMSRQASR